MDHEAEYQEATKQAQRALDRMKRANERGTGCYLTAEMIESLAVTKVGELWEDELSSKPSR